MQLRGYKYWKNSPWNPNKFF